MKKFFTISLFALLMLSGCEKIQETIDNVNGRLDAIESVQIASLQEQINAINKSIPELEATDKELKAYIASLQTTATNLKEQIDAANSKAAQLEDALNKALELIPEGSSVGWGGTMTATDMGLINALRTGNYKAIDRDKCATMEEREKVQREVFFADAFVTGANALSLDGQMVNIDGTGNRVAPIIYPSIRNEIFSIPPAKLACKSESVTGSRPAFFPSMR